MKQELGDTIEQLTEALLRGGIADEARVDGCHPRAERSRARRGIC
jgi:hypothetical protein